MAVLKTFKELTVWQKATQLTLESYNIAKCLPAKEKYGLASQITRSAVSIPVNIAEGYGRNGRKEYIYFLGVSAASARELEALLTIVSLAYSEIETTSADNLLIEVQKMLWALRQKLQIP